MRLFSGIGASEGFAVGVVRRLHHIQTATGRQVRSPSQEKLLYEQAVETAKQQLAELEQAAFDAAGNGDIEYLFDHPAVEAEGDEVQQKVAYAYVHEIFFI